MMRAILYLAILYSTAFAFAALAKDETCTYGQTCFCDCINNTDGTSNDKPTAACTPDSSTCFANTTCQTNGTPIVPASERIMCEDFEGDLNNGGCGTGSARKWENYWFNNYSGVAISTNGACGTTDSTNHWYCCGPDGLPDTVTVDGYLNMKAWPGLTPGLDVGGAMQIIATAPDGPGCTPENTNETDCIFQGNKSYLQRFWGQQANGSAGASMASWFFSNPAPDFTIQWIRKWTGNFQASGDCQGPDNIPAVKDIELGREGTGGANCTLSPTYNFPGNNNYQTTGPIPANLPFAASSCGDNCVETVGQCENFISGNHWSAVGAPFSVWDWRGTGNAGYNPASGQATWVSWVIQENGYKTSSNRHRQFVNKGKGLGREALVDMTHDSTHTENMTWGMWDAYYNNDGWEFNGGGYCTTATEPGYRGYDNFLIKKGDPLTDAQLGFGDQVNLVDTWTIPDCPAAGCFNLSNPSTCTQGACSAAADAAATADGTASGTITWEIDSDCDNATGLNYVDIDTLGSGAVCINSNTCNRADVCDYSAKTANTYTATIRSCVGAICDTATDTFQVLAPQAQPPGNRFQGGGCSGCTLSWLERYRDPYSPMLAPDAWPSAN